MTGLCLLGRSPAHADGRRGLTLNWRTPMKTRWTNEPGIFLVEIEEPLPFIGEGELAIHYRSSGFFDSGCRYLSNGDPGYPPEWDHEVKCDYATLDGVNLDDATAKMVFDHFADKISEHSHAEGF